MVLHPGQPTYGPRGGLQAGTLCVAGIQNSTASMTPPYPDVFDVMVVDWYRSCEMGSMADTENPNAGKDETIDSGPASGLDGIPITPEVVKAEESLSEKVGTLRDQLATISEQVDSQRKWSPEEYQQSLETLRQQVDSIHAEWESVATKSRVQRDQLESLLQTFPGAIETATLRALTMRVNQIESLISALIDEKDSRDNSNRARKQMVVSLVALGVTVALWGVWIVMSVTR